MPIAQAMKDAHDKGRPIPTVVCIRGDEEFSVSRIKHLIQHMTRYKVKDRMALPMVHKEIRSILSKITQCSQTVVPTVKSLLVLSRSYN